MYEIDAVNGSTVTTCSGTFFDSGGAAGGFQTGEAYVVTFCPSGGVSVQLDFTEFDVPLPSQLCFYDGVDATAPLLICADNSAPVNYIGATAGNTTGCITVSFTSGGTGGGWAANVQCATPCQLIEPFLAAIAINGVLVPTPYPAYIDLCQSDTLLLGAIGQYPQNGTFYNHDDNSSLFIWSINGEQDTGQIAGSVFNQQGGFIIQLSITDQNGCQNLDRLNIKVRVSTTPYFNGDVIRNDTICIGDTATLGVDSLSGTALIYANPVRGDFAPPAIFSQPLFLPDDVFTPYTTTINVSSFNQGQTVQNINDIQAICVNMEHSFLGDLDLVLSCPNGQNIILHDFGSGGGGTYLGEPCDDPSTTIGDGYEYCFVENAPAGTWAANAGLFTYSYVNNDGLNVGPNQPYMPAGDYAPAQTISGLIGCPLNGNWTITITDNLGIDDGFIFAWGVEFNPNLYPNLDTFIPTLVAGQWLNGPGMIVNNQSFAQVSPAAPGSYNYTYVVEDNFGCTYDTTITVLVLPQGDLACLSCDSIFMDVTPQTATLCPGQSVQLNADVYSPLAVPTPICDDYDVTPIPHAPVAITGTAVTLTDDQLSGALPIGFTFNFFCNDYTQFHISSNGFITFNGASGSGCCSGGLLPDPFGGGFGPTDLIALCWDDLNPGNGGTIRYSTVGTAPNRQLIVEYANVPFFGGTNSISGQIILYEGTNIVEVHSTSITSPGFNTATQGILNDDATLGFPVPNRNSQDWSATNDAFQFTQNSGNPFASTVYTWSPTTGLVPTSGPSPVATPSASTNYVVTAVFNQCTWVDTVEIAVVNIGTPVVSCGTATNTSVTFNWTSIQGAVTYEISLDGGTTWINVGTNLTYQVTGMTPNSTSTIRVRAIGVACTGLAGTATCTATPCTLLAPVVSCVNVAQTTVTFGWAAVAGATSYEISLDGGNVWVNVGNTFSYLVSALFPGQTVTIQVRPLSASCTGPTTTWSCTASPCNLSAATISCGIATQTGVSFSWTTVAGATAYEVSTNGGTTWQNVGNVLSFSVNGLTPGQSVTISVRALDGLGCTGPVASFSCTALSCIMTIQAAQFTVGCEGQSNSSATVSASDGTAPYSYSWSNGDTQNINDNLAAGVYTVTVTDAVGCTASAAVTITENAYPSVNPFVGSAGVVLDTILAGDTIQLFSGFNDPGVTYTWTPATNLGSATGSPVTATLNDVGLYSFTVTADLSGCTSTGSVSVYVIPGEIKIANAFTPNGDEVNQYFGPEITSNITIKEFKVYNRWGALVYDMERDDPSQLGWDGTFNGELQPRDAYIYRIKLFIPEQNADKLYTGDVTLLR